MSIYIDLKKKGVILSKEGFGESLVINKSSHKLLEKKIDETNIHLDDWKSLREEMTLNEWIDFILISIGYEPSTLFFYEKLFTLARLIPFCEKKYHIIELGPKALGKSYMYESLSDKSTTVTGNLTIPSLFVDKRGKEPTQGVINIYSNGVVGFDEMSEISDIPDEVVQKLRNFMASGNSGREGIDMSSNCSLVFIGNIKDEDLKTIKEGKNLEGDLYDSFPEDLAKDPFKSRLSLLIPSWNFTTEDKGQHFTKGEGVVANYFISMLIKLRDEEFKVIEKDTPEVDRRGKSSIRSTVSGLLKLLYPHGKYEEWEQEALYNIAIYGKMLISDQTTQLTKPQKNISITDYQNFVLKANFNYLKSLGITSIEEAYYEENRIIVKPLSENIFYKVALDEKGTQINKKEFLFYTRKREEERQYILPIKKEINNYEVIVQEYGKPMQMKNEIKIKIFSSPTINLENIEDLALRKELKSFLGVYKDEIVSLRRELGKTRKSLRDKDKEVKELKVTLQDYLRGIKLEMLELRSWAEKDYDFFQNISESTNFIELIPNEEAKLKEIKEILKIKDLKACNYSVDSNGEVYVINFGYLI